MLLSVQCIHAFKRVYVCVYCKLALNMSLLDAVIKICIVNPDPLSVLRRFCQSNPGECLQPFSSVM